MNYIAFISVFGIINAWVILFIVLRAIPKPFPASTAIALLMLIMSNLLIVLLAALSRH